jgi:formylglycine-generating enzyme required for sulfatase activity/tRNA A-37 threonylcarbamoyl transferase component Bud32
MMTLDRLSLDMLVDGLNRLEAETLRVEAEPEPKPLGRFKVRGQLGSGRFAVVALADDPVLGRPVALKLPRPELLADERMRQRFICEAQAAARLEHEGIVPVHEVVRPGDSVVYLVLGLVNGPNLEEWLEQHPHVEERLACQLVAAIADAVQHAHDRKVLHLDLKPSNILIDPGHGPIPGVGRPRVTDFGLARVVDGTRRRTTALFAGTPGFMAPEQLGESSLGVSERTDVWALGAILFQVLTGRVPFEGSDGEVAIRTLKEDPPSPRSLRPELSPQISAIVSKCLQTKPERRYPSAKALADDLRSLVQGQPISPIVTRPTRRWRPLITAAAGVLVLLTVAGLLYRNWRESPSSPAIAPAPPVASRVPLPPAENFENSIGQRMVRIKAGEYVLGPTFEIGPQQEVLTPAFRITFTKDYYIGQWEVTIGEFRKFVNETGYVTEAEHTPGIGRGWVPADRDVRNGEFFWHLTGWDVAEDQPVTLVTWNDATEFCKWLGERERRAYRLPTEAEWECACRAGTRTKWSFGDDDRLIFQFGNIEDRRARITRGVAHLAGELPDDGYGLIAPVASFEPNAWGIYDMHGNVWEMCLEIWERGQPFKLAKDPLHHIDGVGKLRALRGGSWGTLAEGCRSSARNQVEHSRAECAIGFRIVCEMPPDKP